MLNHIKVVPLIIGIVIGVIGILFIRPEQNISYKYPLPPQSEKTIYKDKNGVCYRYMSKEVNCDKNEDRLKPFPLSK